MNENCLLLLLFLVCACQVSGTGWYYLLMSTSRANGEFLIGKLNGLWSSIWCAPVKSLLRFILESHNRHSTILFTNKSGRSSTVQPLPFEEGQGKLQSMSRTFPQTTHGHVKKTFFQRFKSALFVRKSDDFFSKGLSSVLKGSTGKSNTDKKTEVHVQWSWLAPKVWHITAPSFANFTLLCLAVKSNCNPRSLQTWRLIMTTRPLGAAKSGRKDHNIMQEVLHCRVTQMKKSYVSALVSMRYLNFFSKKQSWLLKRTLSWESDCSWRLLSQKFKVK